jgi:L-fuculose-phosphate aldolase
MTEEMLIKMDLDGNILMGQSPSSETKMHIRVYKENPQVKGVVHAHPPIATTFAIAGEPLELAVLPEAVVNLGRVLVAKYATPGTDEVPDSIAPYCKDYNAVLLSNHGVLTWGHDIIQAYYRLENVEYYAKILMNMRSLNKVNILTRQQVKELLEIRKKLGITTGGIPITLEEISRAQ